jgi:uncharacterized protein DUF6594
MQSFVNCDEESGRYLDPNHGFASAASFIAEDYDEETFVFKRFNELAARNILYLQAGLLSLESELRAFDEQIKKSADLDVKDTARSWEAFTMQLDMGNELATDRMKLIISIRAKIKEYRKELSYSFGGHMSHQRPQTKQSSSKAKSAP